MEVSKDFEKAIKALQEGNSILPTGTCFDDAIDLIEHWIFQDPQIDWHKRIRLGHGICGPNEDNKNEYAHAWVELDGKEVWQDGIVEGNLCSFGVDIEQFYRKYKAHDVTLYTLKEFGLKNLEYAHYGPWESRYYDLTKDSKNLPMDHSRVKCCKNPDLKSHNSAPFNKLTVFCKNCGYCHELPERKKKVKSEYFK